jgi:hypothetical protein
MERFIYTPAHLPALKKYGTMKILFALLGSLVLLLQSIAWLVVWTKDIKVDTISLAFVTITLIGSLFFVMGQVFFAIRNRKIISSVKTNGTFEITKIKFRYSNKSSFSGALVLFCRFLAILFVILLGILIVNFIQQYLNWGKIILKMPFMVLCAVGFLNTSAELKFQTMVEKA